MCKDVTLLMANTVPANYEVGQVINFGQKVLQLGCNIYPSGGNVVTRGVGEYDIDILVNFEGSGAGTVTLTAYKNGVAIPGATVSVTTVASEDYSVVIPTADYNTCCCEETITVVVTGLAINNATASMRVKY